MQESCPRLGRASRVRVGFAPARGDGDSRPAEQFLDGVPFPHVIALDEVANILEKVAKDKQPNAPVPGVNEQENHPDERERDANHVNGKVERLPVAFPPVPQGADEGATARGFSNLGRGLGLR